ncbi:hypothetical protein [Paraburkholderia dipogonis]|uniref:hypothetical protein n=1 Tax=Paraburkholderia dipogonis TaxID=1211383 RepID=UPI0038BA1BB2
MSQKGVSTIEWLSACSDTADIAGLRTGRLLKSTSRAGRDQRRRSSDSRPPLRIAIGFLISILFWWLVVYLPERRQRANCLPNSANIANNLIPFPLV